ncbi:Holliday junction resolvase RuvX [Wohlfahrtiimonas chitiniclastica]|uniref:Holliday junction resolvase RuvX n=1 Tax=Wohlfahrtiimonas chitiniclastica TaxID=400946 RepID=UPI000B990494|nr:Holliday junction resolvase RuvX [Wohlfahrtiimonas chitiniclastica]MBS7828806.1 Holliday junction resolvase RuvX [Wohlfahrtiimonas chitiniclastica]MBS7834781.1 Holliday junction resolvase RuvX [Wohlfahrtiimonas chitiniclastica]OYQ89918.1 Holliday junction resolvase RuvX [Wohlfahrtiimonas chitiniclastica]
MEEIVVGFDYGVKNIGLAVGNRLTNTAQPIAILKATDGQPDWEEVARHLKDWTPTVLVVGIPYTADGTETEHIKKIRKFMNRLHGRFGLPVEAVDERLSSQESEQYIKPSKKGKKGQLDAHSAAIIVERYLNGDCLF